MLYVTAFHPPHCYGEGTLHTHCGCGMYTLGYAGKELTLAWHALNLSRKIHPQSLLISPFSKWYTGLGTVMILWMFWPVYLTHITLTMSGNELASVNLNCSAYPLFKSIPAINYITSKPHVLICSWIFTLIKMIFDLSQLIITFIPF